jgi:hypothetical protein
MVHDLFMFLEIEIHLCKSDCPTQLVTWHLLILIRQEGTPDVISSGFYVSTDDIFDDSRWSEAVYFDEIGFDQDVSGRHLHVFLAVD